MDQTLITPNLKLRRWQPSDREQFRALNRDPRVMEFFPALLTAEESDAAIARIERHFELHSFGLYAAEFKETAQFIGFIGLSKPTFDAPFMPAVEIGWRLAAQMWGRGLATEGALAVVNHAFGPLQLASLVSFTSAANLRSRRVMEKIGMVHDCAGDFEHPRLAEHHALRAQVLYRLRSPAAG